MFSKTTYFNSLKNNLRALFYSHVLLLLIDWDIFTSGLIVQYTFYKFSNPLPPSPHKQYPSCYYVSVMSVLFSFLFTENQKKIWKCLVADLSLAPRAFFLFSVFYSLQIKVNKTFKVEFKKDKRLAWEIEQPIHM